MNPLDLYCNPSSVYGDSLDVLFPEPIFFEFDNGANDAHADCEKFLTYLRDCNHFYLSLIFPASSNLYFETDCCYDEMLDKKPYAESLKAFSGEDERFFYRMYEFNLDTLERFLSGLSIVKKEDLSQSDKIIISVALTDNDSNSVFQVLLSDFEEKSF